MKDQFERRNNFGIFHYPCLEFHCKYGAVFESVILIGAIPLGNWGNEGILTLLTNNLGQQGHGLTYME